MLMLSKVEVKINKIPQESWFDLLMLLDLYQAGPVGTACAAC